MEVEVIEISTPAGATENWQKKRKKRKKAACPRCAHYCRPIYYQIKVLVRDGCDPVSGMSLWKWRERRIAVAYVMKT